MRNAALTRYRRNGMLRQSLVAGMMALSSAALAQEATVIVLDASGSMWGQIDGVNKITIAQDVVNATLGAQPATRALGLLAYGHNRKGDCRDIEVLVPPSPGSGPQIAAAVGGINPKGKTPLTAAVQQAAQLLNHTENPATVVLVTDGLETCGADPCALARELERTGVDFTAHVVGFGLSREQGAQVSCVAAETGGRYFQADNATDLSAALSQTVIAAAPLPAPEPAQPAKVRPKHNLQINVQVTEDSPPLKEGEIQKLALWLVPQDGRGPSPLGGLPSQAQSFPPGEYVLRAVYAGGEVQMAVTLQEFDVTHATVVLNGGWADFRAIPISDRVDLQAGLVSWEVLRLKDKTRHDLYEPAYRAVLAEGRYRIQAVVKRAPKLSPPPFEIDIVAGQEVKGEVILPNGWLALTALSDSGENLPWDFIRYGLHVPKADGTPGKLLASVSRSGDAMFAMPGDYVLSIIDWGIAKRELTLPITIAPGEVLDLSIVLPANPDAPLPEPGPRQ